MTEIAAALGGVGLASAAGLNAYIPALLTALLARYTDLVTLPKEVAFLGNGWVLLALTVLLVVEEVVDKIPGADHINDIVQTVVRPASGAVLFAANTGNTFHGHTWLAALVGLVVALTVHTTKSAGRGVINLSTAGIGAPIISVIEDVASVAITAIAILVPILIVLVIAGFIWLAMTVVKRRRNRRLDRGVRLET